MQINPLIYLAYPSYPLSCHVMDAMRLGRLSVQIYGIIWLTQLDKPRRNSWWDHPSVVMWRGYERSLLRLLHHCIVEQKRRGWDVQVIVPSNEEECLHWKINPEIIERPIVHPEWLGVELLHESHRSALLDLDPDWYSQFDWGEMPINDPWYPQQRPTVGSFMAKYPEVMLVTQDDGDTLRCLCVEGTDESPDWMDIPVRDVIRRVWHII